MSKLVICEKPSVAKSIASVLGVTSRADGYFEGNGYLISWCIGHLVGLADAAAYDDRYKKWRYEDLPILPDPFRYVVSEEKADQFHILRSLMERPDVTELVNACDAGREGELIFRLVYEAAGCSKPFSRLWISSMEDAAIREGFADLRPGADYDPLYQSALCRQKADWLIGINASRLFSVLYHRTLNVGRVQTPTLAMLADRDSKIVLFRKEKYHHVRLALAGAEAVSDRIVSPEDAQAIRDACDGQRAVCVSVARDKKTEKPPKLYDLTTLQREANRVFGYTAKQTLDYPSDSIVFSSHGYDLHIDNELVAEAFSVLPQMEQSILILHCTLDLADGKIGNLVGMSRSAVQRHRTRALQELRKALSALMPKGG